MCSPYPENQSYERHPPHLPEGQSLNPAPGGGQADQ